VCAEKELQIIHILGTDHCELPGVIKKTGLERVFEESTISKR
jgi:hypothetical protein